MKQLLVLAALLAPNCGGGIDVVLKNPNVTLEVDGGEFRKATYKWSVGGKVLHEGEIKLVKHYDANVYVSPAANGFVVTCCNRENDLVAFYSPKGERLTQYGWDLLEEKERVFDRIGCCGDTLRAGFSVSKDGWFLVLKAPETGREIRFFLPLGKPVGAKFDKQMAAALEAPKLDLDGLLQQLDDDSLDARSTAVETLKEKAIHHLDTLVKARDGASGDRKARLQDVIAELEPLKELLTLAKDEGVRKAFKR
jgi:hypothetical protein